MDFGGTPRCFFNCQRGNPLTADDSSDVKDTAASFQAPFLYNQLTNQGADALSSAQCIAGCLSGQTSCKFGPLSPTFFFSVFSLLHP